MSDREKLLNLTREATAKIANHCANTSCEKCAKESGKYDKESGKCKCSTMEMFTDHLIENGVTVQRWIPVSERLPEKFVTVLVQMPLEEPCPTVTWGFLKNDGGWYANYFNREDGEVTHWMPMPQPPKGERAWQIMNVKTAQIPD